MEDYERFGPYSVHECLGAGGMATVHRATIDLGSGLKREVALKRLLPQLADDKRFVDDFVREAKLAAQLSHPNIVKILELGRIGRTYFIAMELVHGVPMMSLMRRSGQQRRKWPIGVILSLMSELCDALEHAYNAIDARGQRCEIVHRDLTPSNLLVTEDGHVKIIDFGVAKATSGQFMTNSGLAKGKLAYMSVEAISGGSLDRRADIFSMGVVMWELLTGKRLFKAKNEYDVIGLIREGKVQRPSAINEDCPSELEDIVMKALARDRDQRWSTAEAIRRALDEVRRYYRDGSDPRDVIAWVEELRAEPRSAEPRSYVPPRIESDGESTAMRLSTDDLEELPEPEDSVPVAPSTRGSFESASAIHSHLFVADELVTQESIEAYPDVPPGSPSDAGHDDDDPRERPSSFGIDGPSVSIQEQSVAFEPVAFESQDSRSGNDTQPMRRSALILAQQEIAARRATPAKGVPTPAPIDDDPPRSGSDHNPLHTDTIPGIKRRD